MKVTVQATHLKNEKTSIRIRQQIEGQKVIIPLLQEVPTLLFDPRTQRLTKLSSLHTEARRKFGVGKLDVDEWNAVIEQAVATFTAHVMETRRAGGKVDAEKLKMHVLQSISAKQPAPKPQDSDTEKHYVLEVMQLYVEHATKYGTGKENRQMMASTRNQYKASMSLLAAYEKHTGKPLEVMDFNAEFRAEWLLYNDNLQKARSTSSKHLDRMRTAVKWLGSTGVPIHRDVIHGKMSKIDAVKWHRPVLSLAEIEQIKQADLTGHLDKVRDIMLVQCFTGLRISDLKALSKDKIHGIRDGKPYLQVITQKTRQELQIPLNATVMRIVEKYGDFPTVMAEQQYNLSIKKVCEAAGINELMHNAKKKQRVVIDGKAAQRNVTGTFRKFELVSSHDLRRSFATFLYFETEMKMAVIMELTGWTNERTFRLYIHANKEQSREEARMFMPD